MSSTKKFTIETSILKKINTFFIEAINMRSIDFIPGEIKSFLDEISNFNGETEKTFSPERSVKLRGALVAFVSINNIGRSSDLDILLDGLRAIRTLGDASIYFSEMYDHIYTLLSSAHYRDFLDAKLYFVNEHQRNEILEMKAKLESLITTETQKKKLKFSSVVKFLNPLEVTSSYEVRYRSKYQYISKKESIDKYLPSHFEITKNKLSKNHRELLETHKFSKSKISMLEREQEAILAKMDDDYKHIMENLWSDDFDVKIVSYEHSSLYPEIKFSQTSTKGSSVSSYAHLSKETVNVLWYNPSQSKRSNTIEYILENYNHPFGDVYFVHLCTENER